MPSSSNNTNQIKTERSQKTQKSQIQKDFIAVVDSQTANQQYHTVNESQKIKPKPSNNHQNKNQFRNGLEQNQKIEDKPQSNSFKGKHDVPNLNFTEQPMHAVIERPCVVPDREPNLMNNQIRQSYSQNCDTSFAPQIQQNNHYNGHQTYNQSPQYEGQEGIKQQMINCMYRQNDFEQQLVNYRHPEVKGRIKRAMMTQKQKQELEKQALRQRRLKYEAKKQNTKRQQQRQQYKLNEAATPSTASAYKYAKSASNQPNVSTFNLASNDQPFQLRYEITLQKIIFEDKNPFRLQGEMLSDRNPIGYEISQTIYKHIEAQHKQIQQAFAQQPPTIYSNIQYLGNHIHLKGRIVMPLLLAGLGKNVNYSHINYNGDKVQQLVINHPNDSIEFLQPVFFGDARGNRDLSKKLILTDKQIDGKQSYLNKKCKISILIIKKPIIESDKKSNIRKYSQLLPIQEHFFAKLSQVKIDFHVSDWLVSSNLKSKLQKLRTIVHQKVQSVWNNAEQNLKNTRI